MLNGMIPTGFKNIIKTYKVAFDIYIGICNRIPHARLCRKIHNYLGCVFRKNLFNKCLIRKISFYKSPFAIVLCLDKFLYFRKSVFLNGNIIIIIQVVKPDKSYTSYGIQKFCYKVSAYKTGGARNKNGFVFKIYI